MAKPRKDLPKKQELIDRILSTIDDVEASEETVLQGLRVLKKFDRELCIDKAMSMYSRGERPIAVSDLLLSLIPTERVDTMGMIEGDFTDE